MIYPIVIYGNKTLRTKTKYIDFETDMSALIKDMYETMYQASGVGLAAPQINIKQRIFITDTKGLDSENPLKEVFINPKIIEHSENTVSISEGCLSIPGVNAHVSRYETIRVSYFNASWEKREKVISGTSAIVIQHEYDHLNGILFIDKVTKMKKNLISNKLNKIQNGKFKCNYLTL